MAIDSGDSNELIKLDIHSEAAGLSESQKQLAALNAELAKVDETLKKVAGNKGMEKIWDSRRIVIATQAQQKLNEVISETSPIGQKAAASILAQAQASTKAAAATTAQANAQKLLANATAQVFGQTPAKKMAAWTQSIQKQQMATNAAIAAQQKQTAAANTHQSVLDQMKVKYAAVTNEQNKFTRGFTADDDGKKKFATWKSGMDSIGVSIMGGAKSFSMLKQNLMTAHNAFGSVQKAGVANLGTIKALEDGSSSMFTRAISSSEGFRIQLGMIKRDATSVFNYLHLKAKDTQWLGRQMLQGITLPVIGFGAMAVQSFDRVNQSMLQLKKVLQFKGDFDGMKEDIRNVAHEYAMTDNAVTKLYEDVAAMGVRGKTEIKTWAEQISKLSQLGDVDLGDATTLFRVMNSTFSNGTAADTTKIIGELNAVVDESSIRMKDLVEVLPTAAPVMKNMGFDAAGTAIALTSMYKRGIDANVASHALAFGMQSFAVPTARAKQAIDELGVSFFNTSGQFTDADKNLALMAERINNFSPESKANILGNMFGKRQAGKFEAMFADIAKGIEELRAANADGKITLQETEAFTSDYARTMVASGKVAAEGVLNAADRYNKAWDEFKKDPSTQFARLKGDLKAIMNNLGAFIIQPLLAAGEKIKSFFEVLDKMPVFVKKGIGVLLLMAAALGPIIYAFAQLEHSIATFGKIATSVLPKAFKDIDESTAKKLLGEAPDRTDIKQIGSRFLQVDGKKKGKIPSGATDVTAENMGVASSANAAAAANNANAAAQVNAATTGKILSESLEKEIDDYDKLIKRQATLRGFQEARTDPNHSHAVGKNPMYDDLMEKEYDKVTKGVEDGAKRNRELKLFKAGEGERQGQFFGMDFAKGMKVKMSSLKDSIFGFLKRDKGDKGLDFFKELKLGFQNAKGDSEGFLSTLKAIFSVGASEGGGLISTFMSVAGSLGTIVLVAGPLIAAIGGIIWFAKEAQKHFEDIKIAAEPGFQKIAAAIEYVKAALAEVGQKFMGVINQLSGGAEGDQTVSFWQNLGNIIGSVATGIATAIKWVGDGIKAAWPLIEGIAYAVKDVIGFVSSLVQGDWATAFQYLAAYAWEGVRPIAGAFELLMNIALWAVKAIISGFEWLSHGLENVLSVVGITTNAFSSFFAGLGEGVQKMAEWNLVDYVDGYMRNLAPVFKGGVSQAIPKPGEVGNGPADLGAGLGEKIGTKMADSTKDTAKKKMAEDGWFKDFLSAVKSRIDKSVEEVKQGAVKALEAMHAAEIKVYDDKLKAMDEIEKAEERLFATQAYLEKKREMLYQRSINVQNYQRDRALAIYEGRINDARMLDLQQKVDTHSFNKDMGDLETDRGKELLKQARDDERARIEAEKAASDARFEIQKEAFNKQLDALTEYTPRTIGEYNKMMAGINGLLQKNGVEGWPEMAKSGGDRMLEAIRQANEDIRQDFAWSGEAAITAWIAAFADADVIAILKSKAKDTQDALKDEFGPPESGLGPDGVDINDPTKDPMNMNKPPEMPEPPKPPLPNIDNLGSDWVQDFWNGVEKVKNWFKEMWKNITDWAGRAWDDIKKAASVVWDWLYGIWDDLQKNWFKSWDELQAGWGVVTSWFSDRWNNVVNIFNGLVNGMSELWDAITSSLGRAWNWVCEEVSDGWNWVIDTVKNVWTAVASWFYDRWNNIVNIWNGIVWNISEMWDAVTSTIGDAISAVSNWFADRWENIKNIASGVWNWISETWNNLKNDFLNGINVLVGWFQTGWNLITQGFDNFKNAINLGNIWDGLKNGFKGALNMIIGWWNDFSFTIPKIEIFGKTLSDEHRIDTPNITPLEAGGWTKGLSVIGEGNKRYPEVVIPTDPAYRARAFDLTNQLMGQLNAGRTAKSAGTFESMAAKVSASAGSQEPQTVVYVDTMIGEEEWFVKNMDKYDVKIAKKKADSSGSQNRVIGSYNENQRGAWKK